MNVHVCALDSRRVRTRAHTCIFTNAYLVMCIHAENMYDGTPNVERHKTRAHAHDTQTTYQFKSKNCISHHIRVLEDTCTRNTQTTQRSKSKDCISHHIRVGC